MVEPAATSYVGRRYRLYPTREQAAALKQSLERSYQTTDPDEDPRSFALSPGNAPEIKPLVGQWAVVSVPDVGEVKLRLRRPLREPARSGTVMRGMFGWHLGLVIELKRTSAVAGKPHFRLVRRDQWR